MADLEVLEERVLLTEEDAPPTDPPSTDPPPTDPTSTDPPPADPLPEGSEGPIDPALAALQLQTDAILEIRNTSVAALRGTFSSVLTGANAVFDSALATAGTQLNVDLATYSGNPTMFALPDFEWPDAPDSAAFELPNAAELPAPPGERPTYSGAEYEFSLDQVYVSSATAIDNLYASAAESARNDALDAVAAANAAEATSVSAANLQRMNDRQAAVVAYNAYISAAHPTINLSAVQIAATQAIASAFSTMQGNLGPRSQQVYNELAALEAQLQTDLDAAVDAAQDAHAARKAFLEATTTLSPMEIETDAQAVQRLTYATLAAAAYLIRVTDGSLITANAVKANASDLLTYELALHAADASVATAMVEVAAWAEQRMLEGAENLSLAYLQADRTFAVAEANALQTQTAALATAATTRTNAITAATVARWNARAALKESRLQAWSQSDGTPWSAYQASLGTAESQRATTRWPCRSAILAVVFSPATMRPWRATATFSRRHRPSQAATSPMCGPPAISTAHSPPRGISAISPAMARSTRALLQPAQREILRPASSTEPSPSAASPAASPPERRSAT